MYREHALERGRQHQIQLIQFLHQSQQPLLLLIMVVLAACDRRQPLGEPATASAMETRVALQSWMLTLLEGICEPAAKFDAAARPSAGWRAGGCWCSICLNVHLNCVLLLLLLLLLLHV